MLLIAGLVFGGALFSQAQKAGEGESKKESEPVDVMMDRVYGDQELARSLGIEERVQFLVGNVAFHQNGAVISCDSAVRYYATNRIDCYKNVIINQDSTYVYGERAEYNGDNNTATVFSPVVKVVDGDATIYTTEKFTYDTAQKIGRWSGGGVVYQQDNVMEAERGYYYSDLHEMVGVRGVQMKNDSHELISDSVRYNTDTKIATFYTRTYIWTKEGEMISALRGRYNSQDSTYFFRDSAYILDEFRETWADTIYYAAQMENAVFYGNVQIDDNEHDSSAFGDLAHYWGERGETRLTRHPSLLNYDADQGNTDTLYMRADTVYMFVRYPSDGSSRDSLKRTGAQDGTDRFAHLKWVDSLSDSVRVRMADSLAEIVAPLRSRIAELNRRADSIMNVLYPPEPEPEPSSEDEPVVVDSLPEPATAAIDSLPVVDSLVTAEIPPVADSLSGLFVESLLTPPEPESPAEPELAAPERIEPPEVVELRLQAAELKTEADRLASDEGYIRPATENVSDSTPAADSLLRMRLDSTARADSLVRIDSIRIADPKAYKALEKTEARRIKAEKARRAAERREEKFAAKAERRAEKARLRAEKRAAKAAEIARRRRSVERDEDAALLDSLAMIDSLARRDSLILLDSLMLLDSLALRDSLPAQDSAAADTTLRIFRGWRNVKIWRTDMQAVADSMVGFSVDSTLHMYKDPILWHGDNQVTADSIVLYTKGQQIEHAEFFGSPIMGSQIGVDNGIARQFNQVKGERMVSWFEEGALQRHDTEGSAEALYYMQEEEQGADGRTVMSDEMAFLVMTASNMSFIFRADSLRYIVPRNVVDYTVYPMEQIPGTQPTQMQGFVWQIDRQPTLSDVFDRTVRPTERSFYEGLARPDFPIATRIDRRREYLIQNRMWADRSDPLPAYAIEFRRQRYREESPQQ
jgi:lipopolysaccharide export system protein LptA